MWVIFFIFILGNFSCGKGVQNEFRPEIKINSPPTITSGTILPEQPYRESDLDLVLQSTDPDGDPVTYRYQWIKNDQEMAGETKGILNCGKFKKGDLIRVRVISSDGKTDGEVFLSDPVRIMNTPPVLEEVSIEPNGAYANDDLRVKNKASDLDGDTIHYSYRWKKNGAVLEGETREVLPRGRFKNGDRISVSILPQDGESEGLQKRAETTILDSPPMIVSTPPVTVEGNKYLYQVKAYDPDNDPIAYALRSGPKGMEIHKGTGLIRWVVQPEDQGSHLIEIEASNKEGARSSQRYTLSVEIR
jgi:hypothetical protein